MLTKKDVVKAEKSILNLKNDDKRLNSMLLRYWKKFWYENMKHFDQNLKKLRKQRSIN